MNWRTKAVIQNLVDKLPGPLSYGVYYWIQRNVGALRRVDPKSRLIAGLKVAELAGRHGVSAAGARILEVGTGCRLGMPTLLWLLGAERIVTVDLNPYLKEELIAEDLAFFLQHPEEIEALLGDVVYGDRYSRLIDLARRFSGTRGLMDLCSIE